MSKGEVDSGLAELRALAEEDPANPWRWTTLGREARIEGRIAESQAALDRASLVGSEGDARQQAENNYQRFLSVQGNGPARESRGCLGAGRPVAR